MDGVDVTIKVCVDLVLLIIAGCPILIFKYGVDPFKRGFFCDDESISHPYKNDTISTAVLSVLSLGIPFITMIVGELLIYRKSSSLIDIEAGESTRRQYSMFKRNVHPYLAAMYISYGAFLIGCAICQSTTDLIKYSIGRLRPHFLDACDPDWSKIQCLDAQGYHQYVEDFECRGDPKHVREARLSHPSGHASLSMFAMLYFCFYLQTKLTWRGSKLLRHFLQFVAVYMAVYCCMSRVSDYKHHWSDVLGGMVLGTIVASITAVYISDLCKRRRLTLVAEKLSDLQKSLGRYELQSTPSTVHNELVMQGQPSLQI